MTNGTRKMMDSRYESLYPKKGQKVDGMKGRQLEGQSIKKIPTFMESAYSKSNKNKSK